MSSSGLLYHYIRGNYKWPRAGDGEPIRSQIGCQPKTNCLLALTEGFYLHNSNPKPKQSALTTPITQLFTSTSREKPRPLGDRDSARTRPGLRWGSRSRPPAAPKQAPALPRGPPARGAPPGKHGRGPAWRKAGGGGEERQVSKALFTPLPSSSHRRRPNLSPQRPLAPTGPCPAHSAPHPPGGPRNSKGPGEGEKGSRHLRESPTQRLKEGRKGRQTGSHFKREEPDNGSSPAVGAPDWG